MPENLNYHLEDQEEEKCSYCGSTQHDTSGCPQLHEKHDELEDLQKENKPLTSQETTEMWANSLDAEMELREEKDQISQEEYEVKLEEIRNQQKAAKGLDELVGKGINVNIGDGESEQSRYELFKGDEYPNLELSKDPKLGVKTTGFVLENTYAEEEPLAESKGCKVKDSVLIGTYACLEASDGTFNHCHIEGVHILSRSARTKIYNSNIKGLHAMWKSQKMRVDESNISGSCCLSGIKESVFKNSSIRSDIIAGIKGNIFVNCLIQGADFDLKDEDLAKFYQNNLVLNGIPEGMLQKCDFLDDSKIKISDVSAKLKEQFSIFILK